MAPNFSLSRLFSRPRGKQKIPEPVLPVIESTPIVFREQVKLTPEEIVDLRQHCRRFRILIIGRANSGKTTILQRVCNTKKQPIVHDEQGHRLSASVLDDPTAMRGNHNIKLEITYEANPRFVFHDSRGFEASSVKEIDQVWEFINDRLSKINLKDRLHAIWFCVSTESNRVAFDAELEFFKKNTGDIPVILLFTKWDARIVDACSELISDHGMELEAAMEKAPEYAEEVLKTEFIPVFEKTPHPPASYSVLGYLDNPKTKCPDLSTKTADALSDGVLKKLFVSVQTQNIGLCIKNAIRDAINITASQDTDDLVIEIAAWFPHLFYDRYHYHSRPEGVREEGRQEGREIENEEEHHIQSLLKTIIEYSQQAFSHTLLRLFCTTISVTVVLAHSFELKKGITGHNTDQAIIASANEFLASPQCGAINSAIASQFKKYKGPFERDLSDDEKGQLTDALVKICMDNLLK